MFRVKLFVVACVATVLLTASAAAAYDAVATWYGPGLEGNTTACGQTFDPSAHTAASLDYECGQRLLITYQGESVEVVVNDKGPYSGADIDLSEGAAQAIGMIESGVATVDIQELDPGEGNESVQDATATSDSSSASPRSTTASTSASSSASVEAAATFAPKDTGEPVGVVAQEQYSGGAQSQYGAIQGNVNQYGPIVSQSRANKEPIAGLMELPATSGANLLALGAGVVLIVGGILARRIGR